MKNRKTVVLGILGSVLDAGFHQERWQKWRPTVSLARHDDLLIDRLGKYLARFGLTWADLQNPE